MNTLNWKQQQALEAMRARNVGAVWTTAFGWIWPEDVRNDPACAETIIASGLRK
ncbi:hypothetical protein DNFV4_00309 [Nitrospira tepida]|uniref:Uncharacterized protein n=1 Tax=Nitrospira tepida TaxID=2973512 RepID=A0AA86MVQ6_9BACT|nr:hypothetical protein [Nitrospira tepida]CAI4029889.1 hypothetical protein DNFV4_00309 [Nitrospira tepida]